jgi:ABC-type cobalamin transport system permease subunit
MMHEVVEDARPGTYRCVEMSRARFFYGVSAGFGVGWLLMVVLQDGIRVWLALGAAVTLAAALVFHQIAVRASKGRRWRRTSRYFDLG